MKKIILLLVLFFGFNSESQTVWNGTAWSLGVPNEFIDATIQADYNGVSFKCFNLFIETGATLTVSPFLYVSAANNLTVNGTLAIQNSGSFIQVNDSGTVSGAGIIYCVRDTTPMIVNDYTFWSSPMTNSTLGSSFNTWVQDRIFKFNTSNFIDIETTYNGTYINGFPDGQDDDGNAWVEMAQTDIMIPGIGFAAKASSNVATPTIYSVNFTGLPNNGIITVPLVMSGNPLSNTDDFNLIGNPYLSSCFSDNTINANPDISGTLYFWTHTTAISPSNSGINLLNFTSNDYSRLNLTGGTKSVTNSDRPTRYIASCQGFMVRALNPSVFTFNNALRNEGYSNEDFHRTEQLKQYWISLTYEQQYSEVLIDYRSNTSLENDYRYDEQSLNNNNWISVYTVNSNNYKIESRGSFDDNDFIQLGYTANVSGNFTLSSDQFTNFEGYNLILFDSQLGVFHNLQTPYVFATEIGVFDNRFTLTYVSSLNNPKDEFFQVKLFPNPATDTININIDNVQNLEASIIDVSGKVVKMFFETNKMHVEDLSKGFYLVKIKNKESAKAFKFYKK